MAFHFCLLPAFLKELVLLNFIVGCLFVQALQRYKECMSSPPAISGNLPFLIFVSLDCISEE